MELPANHPGPQAVSVLEQEEQDTIPQLDGQVEAKSNDLPHKKTHLEKEDEAVIFKMLDN